MKTIEIEDELRKVCPDIALGCIEAEVTVETNTPDLTSYIAGELEQLGAELELVQVNQRPAIAATRAAYKACGKEPSRYRPSAEALTRRLVQGKGLYQINNVVDLLNLLSARTGYSIGGWDLDQIEGTAHLGIGRENEPYQAIGRGELNIENLPTFRDDQGAFGTPTSDSQRTQVKPETKRFLMVIYAFGGGGGLKDSIREGIALLEKFANAQNIDSRILP